MTAQTVTAAVRMRRGERLQLMGGMKGKQWSLAGFSALAVCRSRALKYDGSHLSEACSTALEAGSPEFPAVLHRSQSRGEAEWVHVGGYGGAFTHSPSLFHSWEPRRGKKRSRGPTADDKGFEIVPIEDPGETGLHPAEWEEPVQVSL